MFIRFLFFTLAAVLGIALASVVPGLPQSARALLVATPLSGWIQKSEDAGHRHESTADGHHVENESDGHKHDRKADGHGHRDGETERSEGTVPISPDRIEAAKIEIAPVVGGVLARRLTVPGTVVPDANRIARVAAKVVGTVADLNKQLGDLVAKGEVVAILDSREVAEAKSEYISAQINLDLAKTLYDREQSLAQARIVPENQFLRTRNTYTEAQLRVALARQKLLALSVSESEIASLSRQSVDLQRYELRSPLAGRIVERFTDLGAPVGGEGQIKEIYVVADLSSVWIDLSVPTADLPDIREGQRITISTGANGKSSEGRIVFISPILNQETRSARVIAAVDNRNLTWRPGSYVTAQVLIDEQPVGLRLPRTALQTIGGEQVVFVRTPEGFEKREVALGKGDEKAVEVVSGLADGESVAVANSFVLKAELGKSEAEHAH